MPAPFVHRPSGVHASALTASPFYSPMYAASSQMEEKENDEADSVKQSGSEKRGQSQHWRPQLSPLLLAASPTNRPLPFGAEVDGGEWTLSPIPVSDSTHSASHTFAAPMSPLTLPLSTSPLPPPSRAQSLPPSSPRQSAAAAPSLSSPFASLHPSPNFHPSTHCPSPTTRPRQPSVHHLDTPPSRPSASPRLSALHHSAAAAPVSAYSRGSLTDVCPSPLLSPTAPAPHSNYNAHMPGLSLDQACEDSSQPTGRWRQTWKEALRDSAVHGTAVAAVQQPQLRLSRSRAQSALLSSSSWWSSSLSWLRTSRLLLFVAVVTGVVLFQLLCAVWLLPASSTSLLAVPRSASIAQLERSRQSAHSFQQSHAGHLHTQHRDDEALRQAVADLQEHVRAHNSDSNHREQQAPHTSEHEASGDVRDGVIHEHEQQPAELHQAAIEPIDAESWT